MAGVDDYCGAHFTTQSVELIINIVGTLLRLFIRNRIQNTDAMVTILQINFVLQK